MDAAQELHAWWTLTDRCIFSCSFSVCDTPHMDRTPGLPTTWQEGRRKRALERKQHGWKPGELAAAVGVSAAVVRPWVAAARARGREAWRAKPRPTGPVQLTSDHWQMLPALVAHGAEASGLRGELWTGARGAPVRWEAFGVSDHQAYVSRLLTPLAWTPHLAIARAAQRDATVRKPWRVQGWPALQKRRALQGGRWSLGTRRAVISCQGGSVPTPHADSPPSCGR